MLWEIFVDFLMLTNGSKSSTSELSLSHMYIVSIFLSALRSVEHVFVLCCVYTDTNCTTLYSYQLPQVVSHGFPKKNWQEVQG